MEITVHIIRLSLSPAKLTATAYFGKVKTILSIFRFKLIAPRGKNSARGVNQPVNLLLKLCIILFSMRDTCTCDTPNIAATSA